MTELEYLDAHPFLAELKDEKGDVRIRVRIRRCPEQGGCGDHPVIEVAHPGDTLDKAPFMPLKSVDACFAFGTMLAIRAFDSEDADLVEAAWGLLKAIVDYRLTLTSTVRRSNLN